MVYHQSYIVIELWVLLGRHQLVQITGRRITLGQEQFWVLRLNFIFV